MKTEILYVAIALSTLNFNLVANAEPISAGVGNEGSVDSFFKVPCAPTALTGKGTSKQNKRLPKVRSFNIIKTTLSGAARVASYVGIPVPSDRSVESSLAEELRTSENIDALKVIEAEEKRQKRSKIQKKNK